MAFENLTPIQVCQAFSKALNRPCKYIFDPEIEVRVSIPPNYREQLNSLGILFGRYHAPYFPGPDFDFSGTNARSGSGASNEERMRRSSETIRGQPAGRRSSERDQDCVGHPHRPRRLTTIARQLWPGYRGIEAYAREVFPVEEEANGKTWMQDKKTQSS